MRDVSNPHWLRVLGWGLLASFGLHWMMFDLMRASAWLPHVPGRPVLRVDLPRDAGRNESPPVPAAANAARQVSGIHEEHSRVKAVPEIRAAVTPGKGSPAEPAEAPLASAQSDGLRSGQPAEAMIALRLGLARSLAAGRPAMQMPASVLLWCDFDGAGKLVSVRDASGATSPALQAWLRRAAEELVVPRALLGNTFSLDVLMESSDAVQ